MAAADTATTPKSAQTTAAPTPDPHLTPNTTTTGFVSELKGSKGESSKKSWYDEVEAEAAKEGEVQGRPVAISPPQREDATGNPRSGPESELPTVIPQTTAKIDEISTVPKKSWREALAGNRDATSGLRLRYVPPTIDGVVGYTVEEVRPTIEKLKFSLIGHSVSYYAMEQYIAARWSAIARPRLFRKDNEAFIFRFQTKTDMEWVLGEVRWTFGGRFPLILQQWSPDMKLDRESLTTLHVWITLPDLDL